MRRRLIWLVVWLIPSLAFAQVGPTTPMYACSDLVVVQGSPAAEPLLTGASGALATAWAKWQTDCMGGVPQNGVTASEALTDESAVIADSSGALLSVLRNLLL